MSRREKQIQRKGRYEGSEQECDPGIGPRYAEEGNKG